MKRILIFLLIFAMVLPLASCGKKKKPKMTVYGDGVVPVMIVSTVGVPSSVVDDLMTMRGVLKTYLGVIPTYTSDKTEKTGIELVFGQTNRAITERANALLPALDGDDAAYAILFDEDGAAVVWNHEYGAMAGVKYFFDTYLGGETLKIAIGTEYVGHLSIAAYAEELRIAAEEKARQEEAERKEKEERAWATRFNVIVDPEVRAAVKDFYEEFYDPEKIIRWWAGLYDPDYGAFYYSNSARDDKTFRNATNTYKYLPDMESTYQICQRLRVFDSGSKLARYLGPSITEKMISFYQTKQDNSDGYFYHPQWTKAESRSNTMRYTRDQDWATTMLDWLGSAPLYPTANDRKAGSAGLYDVTVLRLASSGGSSGWSANKTSVQNYVNNLLDSKTCEQWSNELQTQTSAFKAAGVLGYVLDVLDERINPAYGLWVTGYNASTDRYTNLKGTAENPYGIFTCTYKVMAMYNNAGRLAPNTDKMVENAIKAIEKSPTSDDATARITYIFNPWATLGNVRENVKKYGTSTLLTSYDAQIKNHILTMINALKQLLSMFRCEDGSYGYLTTGSSPTIYGTPVSLGVKEGDVNATNLVMSLAMHICHTVGLDHIIDVFSSSHKTLMKELLDSAPSRGKGGQSQTQSNTIKYDFTTETLNAAPSGTTQSSSDDAAVQNGTTFRVVEEPGNSANKVVEISKTTETNVNGRQLYVPLLYVDKMTDTTVLEIGMRINVTGDTRYGNSITGSNLNIMQIGFLSQSDMFWMPTLRFNGESNPTGYVLIVEKSTSGGTKEFADNPPKTFQFDTWYEFTFRLTIKNFGKSNAQFRVEILVDGESFGTSQNFYSDSIAFKEEKTVRVRFQPQMRIHALIYVDDISAKITTGN